MDADLHERFNKVWSPELFARVRADLRRRLGGDPPFPVAETPLFMSADVRDRFARAAEEVMELLCDPSWIAAQEDGVPEAYRAGERGRLPQFAQIDFAVVRDRADGRLVPRLVELQGFPSLYGFQIQLADVWATHLASVPGLPRHWRLFFSGQDRYRGMALLRDTIVGNHDPEHVVLLDVDPAHQKTWPDFAVTRRWFGVDPVCVTELAREKNHLVRMKDGRRVPVKRIYHRIVFDELEKKGLSSKILFEPGLEVEWAPHPAWFFLWSKRSMLSLDHPSVPKTVLLSDLAELPTDHAGYVLKPLYSFAGGGVNIDPTPEDVAAIPVADQPNWVLQEKVEYCDVLKSADGEPVKAELRMMFVRPDGHERMMLLLNLVRLSRGKMMGVDYNKDLAWTGSSVGIWRE